MGKSWLNYETIIHHYLWFTNHSFMNHHLNHSRFINYHHSWFINNISSVNHVSWLNHESLVNHESLIIHLWFIINHDSLIIHEWWFINEWWEMMMNVDKWIKNHDSVTLYDSLLMINKWRWWNIIKSGYSFMIDEWIMDDDSSINNYWIFGHRIVRRGI